MAYVQARARVGSNLAALFFGNRPLATPCSGFCDWLSSFSNIIPVVVHTTHIIPFHRPIISYHIDRDSNPHYCSTPPRAVELHCHGSGPRHTHTYINTHTPSPPSAFPSTSGTRTFEFGRRATSPSGAHSDAVRELPRVLERIR